MSTLPATIAATQTLLAQADYVAGRSLATTVFLALKDAAPAVSGG